MNGWLDTHVAALGAGPLSEEEVATLLDLAGHAAHDSGDRRNAPLLCYLVGRAQGDRSLDELVKIVKSTS